MCTQIDKMRAEVKELRKTVTALVRAVLLTSPGTAAKKVLHAWYTKTEEKNANPPSNV